MAIELEHPWAGCRGWKVFHKKDGRYRLNIRLQNGGYYTTSYARYVLSVKLGRKLKPDEQADHIDGDYTNDSPENLQILSGKENSRKYILQSGKTAKLLTLVCPICKVEFSREARQINIKVANGGVPCCSRRCGYVFGARKAADNRLSSVNET